MWDFRVRSFVAVDSEVVRCGHDLVVLRIIAMESSVSGPREGENNSFIDIQSYSGIKKTGIRSLAVVS